MTIKEIVNFINRSFYFFTSKARLFVKGDKKLFSRDLGNPLDNIVLPEMTVEKRS